MTRKTIYVIIFFLYSLFNLTQVYACDSALPVQGLRDDVLVIVNDNSIDSCEVGRHYAESRHIGKNRIAHVLAHPSFFTNWDDFRNLRDQIIKFMQENTLPANVTPVTCLDGEPPYYCEASVKQLRDSSSIKYIVTTKGIPTRTPVDGSQLNFKTAPTSVDNYLRHWLVNYYSEDKIFSSVARAKEFGDGRGMRIVEPAIDKELIIGRIDGITLESANRLVDRAISAEQNGVFGKLYGDKSFGRWWDYAQNKNIYGSSGTAWRYQHGIFGEYLSTSSSGIRQTTDSNCVDYLDFDLSTEAGKSPSHCVVRLTAAGADIPARVSSRVPDPHAGLVYLGSLDGQVTTGTTGSFNDFLNWKRVETCSDAPLCKDTIDPAACRAASTDVFKEINTDCVGVADGFIGYNFQSFPVSYLTIWPTSWYHSASNRGDHWTADVSGGGERVLSFPQIVSDDSVDGDGYSLWVKSSEQIINPQCYKDKSFSNTESCVEENLMRIANRISFSSQNFNSTVPQTYRVSLKVKANKLDRLTTLKTQVLVHETGGRGFQVDYGVINFTLPGDVNPFQIPTGNSADWLELEAIFTIDPALHEQMRQNCLTGLTNNDKKCKEYVDNTYLNSPWDGRFDGIKIRIESEGVYSGGIGIDDVRLLETTQGASVLVDNASFSGGHEQVAVGDHAANFLNRLNGVAFWGSVGHHESSGYSFSSHPMETLIYFLRGLPLGDSVWFAEKHNNGILYGDPLYSPVAIRFNYTADETDGFTTTLQLSGDTINGRDAESVSTTYEIDYCNGNDFYVCDQNSSWLTTGLSGEGGQLNQTFGIWDATALPFGDYTLRLKVTSHNSNNLKTQSFYDYYSVTKRGAILDGTINDINGQPVVGVQVMVADNYQFRVDLTTDMYGYYRLENVPNQTYIVYPTRTGYQFSPVEGNIFTNINNNSDVTKNFIATAQDYSISGFIHNANGMPMQGVNVMINDNNNFVSTTSTNANGFYQQAGLSNTLYIVYPTTAQEYWFESLLGNIFQTISGSNIDNKDFIGHVVTYSISGTVTDENLVPVAGAQLSISNSNSSITASATSDVNGNYLLEGLPGNQYYLTVSHPNYAFSPKLFGLSSYLTGFDFVGAPIN